MTIETLEKRIAGKQAAIEKLNKKMERVLAAKATNWEKNPYYYGELDITHTNRELESEKKALAGYEAQLAAEKEKAASRNVPVLVNFLETWKVETIAWFKEEKVRYDEAKEEYYREDHIYCDTWNSRGSLGLTKEEIKKLEDDHRDYCRKFRSRWSHVTQFNHGDRTWEENLERDIEIEKNRKYDDIINRTNEIVGKITDASGLRVGAKQDLNGYIIGERGTAKVTTIPAEGPIQKFHFRTLIHKEK